MLSKRVSRRCQLSPGDQSRIIFVSVLSFSHAFPLVNNQPTIFDKSFLICVGEQSSQRRKQMKLKVTDNQQLDNKEIIKVFNNIKISFNETIKNEEKKEFLITLSDFVCNDLIRRGNLINNRKNILRPLSPHLPIYKPQLTSTFSIYHRISGAFLATLVLFFYLLCLKIGLICFTYENFYQFFFFSSKLILISVGITALALSYHLYNGVRHLLTDFSGFIFQCFRIGRS